MRLQAVLIVLALASLACMEQVATITPSPTPTASPTAPATPSPTAPPTASATELSEQVATVKQPVVRVRDAADGTPTGEYITAGQTVTIVQIVGDWVQIAEPEGWVFVGCLENLSKKGCIADE